MVRLFWSGAARFKFRASPVVRGWDGERAADAGMVNEILARTQADHGPGLRSSGFGA